MARVRLLILLLCIFGAIGVSHGTPAQEVEETPVTRSAGTTANLFETLDPSSPISGARLQLPTEWEIQDVHLLRYGTKPVSIRRRVEPGGTVLLTTKSPIQGPHELVLRVRTGENPDMYEWRLTPFVLVQKAGTQDSLKTRYFLSADQSTHRVKVEPPARPDGPNRAVDLREASRPLLLRSPDRLSISRATSFTVEFWMRTSGLDEVVLSTWTGKEGAAYPAEFVVDTSGRLRFYCGRSGQHQALRTQIPVADGHWHHAAIVYDKPESRLRLVLDGAVVDSARAQTLPFMPDAPPMAIGGRRTRRTEDETDRSYTGRLDKLLVWPRVRSEATLRRMRERPASTSEKGDGGPLHVGFERNPGSEPVEWSQGARRIPTSLSFRASLQNLQAQTEGRTVTLRWETEAANETPFIVERSTEGTSFSPIARIQPSNGAAASSQSREIMYTDENVSGQVVYYRVRQENPDETLESVTRTVKIGLGPKASDQRPVELVGNFPNPFETSTTIAYRVERSQALTLTVWDLSGKRVATLADGRHDPGYYEETLDGSSLPSGPYFARLRTARGMQSSRMMLLK